MKCFVIGIIFLWLCIYVYVYNIVYIIAYIIVDESILIMLESCKILILNAQIDLAPLNALLMKDAASNNGI